ncbi:MAG: hypothetical protein SOU16_04715 [Faecalimonas sp.]|nr:hypothetical protein [Faecalimonas sp.]
MKRKVVVALIASLAIAQVGVGVVKRNQYVVNAKSPSNVSVQNVQKTLDESFFEKMVEKGILNADKNVKEEAEESVTRQEFVIALYRMAVSPLVLDKNEAFADIDYTQNNELVKALKWAEEEKLFDGLNEDFFQDGKFDAEKALSRQEAMQILSNYAEYKEMVSMYVNKNALDSVADKDAVADWAKDAVKWAFGNGFVDTDSEQKINPEKEMTNEESAKLLSTYLDLQKRVENERTQEESSKNHNDYVSVNTGNAAQSGGQSQTENTNSETPNEPSAPEETPNVPMTPLEPSTPHEHNWVDNIVTIEHPEEGHWEKVLVKDAWDETVHHDAVYEDKWIVDKEAWDETIHHDAVYEDRWIVDKEAWDETIHHDEEGHWEKVLVKDAWDETIHHDEEGHWEKVLVKDAWDEEVPIYEEQIRHICNNPDCGEDITGFEDDHMYKHLSNGELAGWHDEVRNVQVGTDIIHHDAVYEDRWIVDKEAWDETIHHNAVYEDKWIVDKEAWDETIHHDEEGHWEKVLVKDAWDETIHHDEEGHWEKVLVKDAWDEIIHHDAIYEDKWIVDKEAWTEEIVDGKICSDCGKIEK